MVMDARMRAWASMHACVRVPLLHVFDCVCVCWCMGIAVCLVRVHLCGGVAVHAAVHARGSQRV